MITVKKVTGTQALAKFHELVERDARAMQEHEILTRHDLVSLGDEPTLDDLNPKTTTINIEGFRNFLAQAANEDPDFRAEIVTAADIDLMQSQNNTLQQIPNGVIISSGLPDGGVSIKDKVENVRKNMTNDTVNAPQIPKVKAKF